jgi:hypothetical protein
MPNCFSKPPRRYGLPILRDVPVAGFLPLYYSSLTGRPGSLLFRLNEIVIFLGERISLRVPVLRLNGHSLGYHLVTLGFIFDVVNVTFAYHPGSNAYANQLNIKSLFLAVEKKVDLRQVTVE